MARLLLCGLSRRKRVTSIGATFCFSNVITSNAVPASRIEALIRAVFAQQAQLPQTAKVGHAGIAPDP
jgi:hypothetical protein